MIKIKISYFYQIRFFPTDHIPLSTACGDPAWFHDFTYDKNYQFKDKRGIWNGLRAEIFSPKAVYPTDGGCRTDCPLKNTQCQFLKLYEEYLDTLDYNEIIQRFEKLNQKIKEQEGSNIDYTFVLIVHEAPNNPCSERHGLIKWFSKNNYKLEEFIN